ncbi:transglycosylase domain-containing protein [Hephaestia mangrovi]|uniref:transglycosylase domain-containing protein n=1 Tax=Hephaestia mangrovi TaxID=2873268 RepID=UPI0021048F05|nr:PBP1A family penicillin-binding protein [Hephaestia mangrovi]
MRLNPFESDTISRANRPERFDLDDLMRRADEAVGYGDADADWGEPTLPPKRRTSKLRWAMRGLGVLVILFVLLVAWLAVTAPLSKSLQPPTPPSITLLASDGTPIARRGAIIGKPVDAANLPAYVPNAFVAIEDRRFYHHWGIDPRGIARAAIHNMRAGGVREGGSTITQQLAKNAFLDADRNMGRKLREVLISFWLEAWLTKDQILSRYLSNVYFGDNVYGLRAASEHYFDREPEDLTVGQAAMLAGLVKAPSALAPTGNLKGARAREAIVVHAMQDGGFITKAQAAAARPAVLHVRRTRQLPNGTYFADWVLPEARDTAGEVRAETTVRTTLDTRLQKAAERAVGRAGLHKAQVALVAMKPDGTVVAMVGGKSYKDSPFNRATQALRQPGSTFKLFVYLTAMRQGLTPDTTIEDAPVTIGNWSPENAEKRYRGEIPLREAFAVSSNVAAARLIQKVGVNNVIRTARDLGISTPIPSEATIALGTANTSLLELTAAYAAIAAGDYPVQAQGLADPKQKGWLEQFTHGAHPIPHRIQNEMRDLLAASVEDGTSRKAALPGVQTFGKTGTTQDSRDALFVGFANGLVCGVWVGNDDDSPNPGLAGGGIPARIWHDFMIQALGLAPRAVPQPAADEDEGDAGDANIAIPDDGAVAVEGNFTGLGLDLKIGGNGDITLSRNPPAADRPPRHGDEEPPASDQ